jgi:hypothetical protein
MIYSSLGVGLTLSKPKRFSGDRLGVHVSGFSKLFYIDLLHFVLLSRLVFVSSKSFDFSHPYTLLVP